LDDFCRHHWLVPDSHVAVRAYLAMISIFEMRTLLPESHAHEPAEVKQ